MLDMEKFIEINNVFRSRIKSYYKKVAVFNCVEAGSATCVQPRHRLKNTALKHSS